MPYQSPISAAIERTTLVLLFLCLFGANALGVTKGAPVAAVISATTFRLANVMTISGNSSQQAAAAPQQKPSPSPTPTPVVAISPAADKMAQSDQGRQYGQPGFVGEPINLNVVNADIRDILNYITEQYGINFVIDSSVVAVPVTVNVQDVPWNVALDAVLKANRLGVEVSGNILRVATVDVLTKEAETQKVIKDSRLDASALVTEFIRLNYARASGTLSQGGGASGNFAGGSTLGGYSPAGGSGTSAGGADQGILPVVQRRLS